MSGLEQFWKNRDSNHDALSSSVDANFIFTCYLNETHFVLKNNTKINESIEE